MPHAEGLWQWIESVSKNLPELSKPQAEVLGMWSYGIAHTQNCGRLTVATFLALVMEEKVANVEQRLYEWCLDAGDKAGKRRVGLDIRECFAPLLRWIVRLWSGTSLALAVDATSLGIGLSC